MLNKEFEKKFNVLQTYNKNEDANCICGHNKPWASFIVFSRPTLKYSILIFSQRFPKVESCENSMDLIFFNLMLLPPNETERTKIEKKNDQVLCPPVPTANFILKKGSVLQKWFI